MCIRDSYRADAFEASHKNVKGAYHGTSQRGEAAQGEALEKMALADYNRLRSGKTDSGARLEVVDQLSNLPARSGGAPTKAKVDAVENDTFRLSRPGASIPAAAIRNWIAEK